jgi:hypothetical protein
MAGRPGVSRASLGLDAPPGEASCFLSPERERREDFVYICRSFPSAVAGLVCLQHFFKAYPTTNRIVPFMGVWLESGESMRFGWVLVVLRIVCLFVFQTFHNPCVCFHKTFKEWWITCMCPQDLPPLGLTLQLVGWVFRIDHEGTIQSTYIYIYI